MREFASNLEPPKKESQEEDISRREALKKAFNTGLGLAAYSAMPSVGDSPEEIASEESTQKFQKVEHGPKVYEMGSLAGRKVGDLFAYYLGVPAGSVVPETLTIDFEKVVSDLWEKKVERVQAKKPDWADNTRMAKKVFSEMYEKRQPEEEMTLESLVSEADEVIQDTNAAVDWEALNMLNIPSAKFQSLHDEDVYLIKNIANRITGKMLIAYSMTELMPALKDHEMNADMYAFLLKNAGPEFLGSIPALSDNYLSVGMFQFTSYAVYDYDGEKRGASIINGLLPKEKRISGSVVRLLTREQQMRAAQLFAIENITRLVLGIRAGDDKKLMNQRLQRLEKQASEMSVGFLQFIASAHHDPGEARQAFRSWIDDNFEGSHAARANERVEGYIRKSHGNYHQLEKLLG